MHAKDWGRARKLANSVIDSQDATPWQKARAYTIIGSIACTAFNDQETAQRSLREVAGYAKMRHHLMQTCADSGIHLAP